MITAWRRHLPGGGGHKYRPIGNHEDVQNQLFRRKHYVLLIMLIAMAGLAAVFVVGFASVQWHNLPELQLICNAVRLELPRVTLSPTAFSAVRRYHITGVSCIA